MRAVLSLAASACLLLSATPAQAEAWGRVTNSQFSYSLIDLDPEDGVTPSISFQPVQTFPQQAPWGRYNYWEGPVFSGEDISGSGPGPFSMAMRAPHARVDGRANGDTPDSVALELAVRADGAGAGEDLRIHSFVVSLSQGFVLSPNTGIIIESRGNFWGKVDRQGEFFDGGGQLSLTSFDADGNRSTWGRGEFLLASLEPGESGEVDRDYLVDTMYWNQSSEAVEGTLDLSVFAYAVSPVPEPAPLALAALGSALVLLRARRRSRRPA
jgi:hypothetical protein